MCFSFVLKTQKAEEKGKISFDVYMDMDEFDNWCDDILDRTMAKQIALERKNSADKPFYTFTTGENGSYKMSFDLALYQMLISVERENTRNLASR